MDLLSNYDFELPEELIATRPIPNRGASRLLALREHDEIPAHDVFANIGSYLRFGDVLVLNNTKVMKARITAFKKTGGRVEILLVRSLIEGRFLALINGKGPFLPGTPLVLRAGDTEHQVLVVKRCDDEPGLYELSCDVDLGPFTETYGELPLPPYFNRRAEKEDEARYQTVFAKNLGAVAAPTAGLHFTEEHLQAIKALGVDVVEITLHVGPGTFLPIRTQNIHEHRMHTEYFWLSEDVAARLNRAKRDGGRIIAVGTTSMRVLEHVMQCAQREGRDAFFPCEDKTAIFIKPGHKFLGCDAIITNFHVPRSSLIVLVSAVAGRERILRAYAEAIALGYRFFSYGDACYLEIRKTHE